jgi:uncharacterized protein involved in exopolysaccharide biosynthesis
MSSSSQIAEIEKFLSTLSKQVLGDEDADKKLLAVLQQQIGVLESPREVIWRMIMEVRPSTWSQF